MKNLIIAGYSGSGKSVIGRNVAELLSFDFVESAECMRDITGYSPEQVLKKYGIVRYCSEEKLIFQKLAKRESAVIAVDSLLCERERLLLLKPNAFFVLLRVEPELLYRRLQKRNGKRLPLAELEADIKRYEDMCLPLCDFKLKAGEYSIEAAASLITAEYKNLE